MQKQEYLTTKYPLAKYLQTLTKESFFEIAYETAPKIYVCLHALGHNSWAKNTEEVENTILELIEHALDDLKKNPKKKSTNCATGRIRVELIISPDWEDKEEVVYPEIVLELN